MRNEYLQCSRLGIASLVIAIGSGRSGNWIGFIVLTESLAASATVIADHTCEALSMHGGKKYDEPAGYTLKTALQVGCCVIRYRSRNILCCCHVVRSHKRSFIKCGVSAESEPICLLHALSIFRCARCSSRWRDSWYHIAFHGKL